MAIRILGLIGSQATARLPLTVSGADSDAAWLTSLERPPDAIPLDKVEQSIFYILVAVISS